ncbi:MAG: hypothetical protein AB7T07_03700 [Steroidobacteraceae bacterium]
MNAKLIAMLIVTVVPGIAVAQAPAAAPVQTPAKETQELVYGRQLMTDAERAEYRAKMRTLKTQQEREAFRLEHHKKMQERAKEKGVTLPDMPLHQGMGMEQGRQVAPGSGGPPAK